MQGLRPPHVETIASDSGTWGGKRRSSQFLASARRLSAILQKAWSGPVPGQRVPSLPGCRPQVTHTASSARSGARPPGWRRTFPSLPPRLSPQPGRFWGPGSPAPWRPWLVRHGGDAPRSAAPLLPLLLAHSSPPASPGLWLDQPRLCSIWGGAPASAGTGFGVTRLGPNPSFAI